MAAEKSRPAGRGGSRCLVRHDPEHVRDAVAHLTTSLHQRLAVSTPSVEDAGHRERAKATNYSRHRVCTH